MFLSMLRDLLSVHTGKLFVELDVRLMPLFKRSFPTVTFLPTGKVPPNIFDVQMPMGDLGKFFRPSESAFGGGASYLKADRADVELIREKINPERKFLIGVSWISKNPSTGIRKSMPTERFFSMFKGIDGVKIASLQYSDANTEFFEEAKKANLDVADTSFVDKFNDIDRLASLVSACDLVISISNVTVHLAGALGKPCWLLLPAVADWRWRKEITYSPWYSCLKLYRQTEPKNWTNVCSQVQADLTKRLETFDLEVERLRMLANGK